MAAAASANKKLIQFLVITLIAVIIALVPAPEGLEQVAMRYTGIFVWLILSMSFRVFPEYLIVLIALSAMLVFKVGKAEEVFAQFTSATLWQIITILALASAIQKTTVLTRVTMRIQRLFPLTYNGQVAALMLTTLVMSLMIPSVYAKIMILAPLALGICESANFEKSSKPAAGLFCAMFVTSFILSNGFITGNSNVHVMMAFANTTFSFMEWIKITWLWTLIMTVGTYLFIITFYRPQEPLALDAGYIQEQIDKLPPMDEKDKKAAVIIGLSLLLWMTESFHGISALAVTLMAYCAFAALGVVTPEEFCTKIDWKLVVLIGGILSIAGFISPLGIATYVANILGSYAANLVNNVWVFIPVLATLVFLARFVIVSQIGTLTIFIAVFQGLVGPMGYHPIIVVFCANMIIQLWATDYNNVLIKPAYAITKNRMVVHRDVAPMAYALFVLSIIAYMASIPLWQTLGLIP
ncbi:MAG: SLC13 family permease [bacterium]|jgi:DASS family divalent anion:Na+ symporter